jgi:hypothetical protein
MTADETFDALFHAILEQRDVDAFVALWAGDDDVTMRGSDLVERGDGIDGIRELGEQIAASSHVIEFDWDERLVHEENGIVWINASGAIHIDDERGDYRLTAILVDRGGEWRWHTFSGSIPD